MNRHARARLDGLRKRVRAVSVNLLGDPILVYQMGKVGSSTVHDSLRARQLRRPLYHVHLLNNLDEIREQVTRAYPNPVATVAQIEKGRRLRKRILRSRRRWHVISLVRDPVQRNVSAFFENLTEVIPDAYERRARGEITAKDIKDAFLHQYDHSAPLEWFQSQLEPVFGIDVYATRFDTENGYATYETPAATLLVIRVENLSDGGADAIREFLGLESFALVNANVGRGKRYHDLYAEFEETVTLPPSYLARMYDSTFARHFYTDEEIDGFMRRWTRGRM